MRSIWKGTVAFGLVNVPVKLFAATESHDISFRQVHKADGARVKQLRVCSLDGEEVPYSDIGKGYETDDGQMIVLDEEDLKGLPAVANKEIAVEKFVPADQIDPILFEKAYYLGPDTGGGKAYTLLRNALQEAGRVALCTIAIKTRTSVAALRVLDDVIVLQTMLWPDEVRAPDFKREVADVSPEEMKMANMLVEALSGDYDPEAFIDDYAEALQKVVQAKIDGQEVKAVAAPKASTEVVDMLAALRKSIDTAKAS